MATLAPVKFFSALFLFLIAVLVVSFSGYAQNTTTISGTILNTKGEPIELVNIGVLGTTIGTSTDSKGYFSIEVAKNDTLIIKVSHIAYQAVEKKVVANGAIGTQLNFTLISKTTTFSQFVVEDEGTRRTTMTRIDPNMNTQIPGPSGSIERLLAAQSLGVSFTSELSSQYNVRGGNFDENLVYVNGIEVYRPFLVRSGQQEGLSFVNSDLTASVLFSSGGFDAKYGDKMSSVLDIKYKEPMKSEGAVSLSLQGFNAYVADASKDYRFKQIHGFRYRTNRYILSSLDTDGDYRPAFFDYQTYLSLQLNPEWDIAFLGNLSSNSYQFVPTTRTSQFGTLNMPLQLTVFFDGQEINKYETYFGAFSATYHPRKNISHKFTTSIFRTQESETFDIEGAYRLSELENDLSKEEFGNPAFTLGVGGFLNHARNYLDAIVTNIEYKGALNENENALLWGLKLQYEDIQDKLNEWSMLDSAGFSVPQSGMGFAFDTATGLITPVSFRDDLPLYSVVKSTNTVQNGRAMGYVQKNMEWIRDTNKLSISAGIRFNYWTFSNKITVSPRINGSWKPNWEKDILFRAAWGYYHQPPFYREYRDFKGNLNNTLTAQRSEHFVLGMDMNFTAWGRPFKFVTELYYKRLTNLVPYEIDNVRLRYYAKNNAKGYAYGLDFKVNGEFVKGVDSWLSVSIMNTQEDLIDDFYRYYLNAAEDTIRKGYTADQVATDSITIYPGYIPRPTDQRVRVGLFFQDYIPGNKYLKMNLNFLFNSGLPFGPPTYDRFTDTLRIPAYLRVDIGFSAVLLKEGRKLKHESSPSRFIKSAWASLEVFNLLQRNNTISYDWIPDVNGNRYGVPNYLTSRQLNLRFIFRF